MNRAAEMTAFVRAVETGGFSAAARDIGLTPSALSKLVTRLEDRLGARLLHRTTRRLQLTVEGEAFFARVRPLLTSLDEAEAEIAQAGASPRGLLRLHCGSAFGMHQLAPAIPRFLARHPAVEMDITISDHQAGAMEEGVDLAIRIGTLDESSMVARRICNLERVICAAPDYLSRHGTPRTPDDSTVCGLPVCRPCAGGPSTPTTAFAWCMSAATLPRTTPKPSCNWPWPAWASRA